VKRPELEAENILAVLNRHGVDCLVIGAFAAIVQGAPLEATHDVDVTPRRDHENLRRLSAALYELIATAVRVRIGEEDVVVASLEDVLRSKEEVRREKDARAALVIRTYLQNEPE